MSIQVMRQAALKAGECLLGYEYWNMVVGDAGVVCLPRS